MRIRTIKPEFFEDEGLAKLSPHHRLLFIGCWLLADRNGVFEYRPEWIKAKIFPYETGETTDVSRMLPDLVLGNYLSAYIVSGKKYLQVRNFLKHQRITGKEAESGGRYPQVTDTNALMIENHPGNNGETPGKHPGAQEQGTGNREQGTQEREMITHTSPNESAGGCVGDDGCPEPVPVDEPLRDLESVPVVIGGGGVVGSDPRFQFFQGSDGSGGYDGSKDQGQAMKPKDPDKAKAEADRDAKFERWFDKYGKKVGKKPAKAKWDKLKPEDQDKCLTVVSAYVKSKPDVQFRKDPTTYLNQECFNDEIQNGQGGRFTKDGLPIDSNGYPDVDRMLKLGMKIEGM
jgi:hypothetical protein